jgi:hypothetical protein
VHAQRLEVMLAQSREGNVAIRERGNLCAVRGMYGVAGSIVDDGMLHISDILHTEQCQLPRRHLPPSFNFIHFIFPAVLEKAGSSRRTRAARDAIARLDLNSSHPTFDLGANQIDVEKPII